MLSKLSRVDLPDLSRYADSEGEWDLLGGYLLCGFPRCGEVVAEIHFKVETGTKSCILNLDTGYVQRGPGLWKLGNHAAKSRHRAPRRVKQIGAPTGTTILSRGSGWLEAQWDGWRDVFVARGVRYRGIGQCVQLPADQSVTIACPLHGHMTLVTFEQLERAYWVERLRHERKERRNSVPA
jgi:hypothetical protein